jgi:hypothetical protein
LNGHNIIAIALHADEQVVRRCPGRIDRLRSLSVVLATTERVRGQLRVRIVRIRPQLASMELLNEAADTMTRLLDELLKT